MSEKLTRLFFYFFLLMLCHQSVWAQQDRIQNIDNQLKVLSATSPGLNQSVQISVTGVSVHDYLNAIASTNKLSISVDPKLNFTVNDVLNGVTAANILLFLAKTYNLDINVVGSIINVSPYLDPALLIKPLPQIINVTYREKDNTLSMELDKDSLGAVAKKITDVSGKNIIIPPALRGKRVTAFIANAPFEIALGKMAYANEIKLSRTSDDFFVFEPLGDNEEVYIDGDHNTSVKKNFKAVNTPPATLGLFSKTIGGKKLISVDAANAAIADLVKQASQELNKNYVLYTELKGTITIHLKDIAYDDFLKIIFQGTDYTFHSDAGIYMIGDSKQEGLRTYKTIKLQNRSLDTVMTMVPSEWKKSVEIKEFREQNTLVVAGSASRIEEIAAFITQLDTQVPVVMLEFSLLDIRKSKTIATGIQAGVSDSVKTGGTILSGLNFTFSANSVNSVLNTVGKMTSINLGHVVPNFYVNLQALESKNNVEARSIPRLTAMNGHTATLSIGNKRYYKNTNQTIVPGAPSAQSVYSNTVFANQYVPVEASLTIMVKPVVSGNDQVTLGIKVDISDFTSIPTDGSPPPQSISKFETNMRVNSEDMIVLGGIERTENDETGGGIPILSSIPVLKWIFGSRSKTNSKVVTMIFIKATVLH